MAVEEQGPENAESTGANLSGFAKRAFAAAALEFGGLGAISGVFSYFAVGPALTTSELVISSVVAGGAAVFIGSVGAGAGYALTQAVVYPFTRDLSKGNRAALFVANVGDGLGNIAGVFGGTILGWFVSGADPNKLIEELERKSSERSAAVEVVPANDTKPIEITHKGKRLTFGV